MGRREVNDTATALSAVASGHTLCLAELANGSPSYNQVAKGFTCVALSTRHGVYCLLLQVESCGQCTPCREGTGWLYDILTRMTRGEAALHEINMLVSTVDKVSPCSSWTDISLGLGGSTGEL